MQDRTIFFIPNNYLDSGTVANGRFALRNAAEGVAMAIAGYFICNMLPITHGFDGISTYIFVCGPLLMLGAAGINGEPVSQFFFNMYRWKKRKNPCFYNGSGRAYNTSAAELLINEPTLRDIVADKVQQLRASMRTPAVEYVEGKNYQFSADPELEALEAADERKQQKAAEATVPDQESDPSITPIAPLDLESLITSIEILDDYEEE